MVTSAPRVSGHIALVQRRNGPQWYMRWRYGGKPGQRRLGPAWGERGRPPEGYYTRHTAQAALDAFLTDMRRGIEARTAPSGARHTFGEACAEWLRHSEHDR